MSQWLLRPGAGTGSLWLVPRRWHWQQSAARAVFRQLGMVLEKPFRGL